MSVVVTRVTASETSANLMGAQQSPYLLAHASQPVHWQPWGEAAFALARRSNKPVFLSIGYSSCHWCQVMSRDSFENPEIAAQLNNNFVPVLVDREERPDVDQVYLAAASAAGWSAGWPLNVWLTPDREPFYGGSYFPPKRSGGEAGLDETLARLAGFWSERPQDVRWDARLMTKALAEFTRLPPSSGLLSLSMVEDGARTLSGLFDERHAGFTDAPKFPNAPMLEFLLREHARAGDARALAMTRRTLEAMAAGAIRDQLAGGFHRYTVDRAWRSPHFEKMLYDSAQLAKVYTDAFQLTGDVRFGAIARETLEYLLRELSHDGGGFYAAQDADARYYQWTRDEIYAALGAKRGETFCRAYGVGEEAAALAEVDGDGAVFSALSQSRRDLFAVRGQRVSPHVDDKIIAGWNGLAISAFANAARVFGDPRYLSAARSAARFLRENAYDGAEKKLFRVWRKDARGRHGVAEDYAFVTQGLLDLYSVSFEPEWLAWAEELASTQHRLFYDQGKGGYYSTARMEPQELPIRFMEGEDGALPAAGSIAVLNELRLSRILMNLAQTQRAEKTLLRFSGALRERPHTLPSLLSALSFHLSPSRRVVVAGDPARADTAGLLDVTRRRYLPDVIVLLNDASSAARRLPSVGMALPIAGRSAAYVCRGKTCYLPVTEPGALAALLDATGASRRKEKR